MMCMDLIAEARPYAYNLAVPSRTFRQRIGDRLLLEREQVKHWSRLKAAIETKISDGTIKAMEQGQNAGWDFFERYARALGLTFEHVCRDALNLDEASVEGLTDEEIDVIATLRSLSDDPHSRDQILQIVGLFRKQAHGVGLQSSAEATHARARGSADSTLEGREPSRRSRSAKR